MILLVTIVISIFYASIIFAFVIGYLKLKDYKKTEVQLSDTKVNISVIIPFKNEENNITRLVHDLISQSLAKEKYEVIFIDDHSSDNSKLLIQDLISDIPGYKLISQTYEKSGKKEAVLKAVSESQGELIITTDADCIRKENWLETIRDYYIKNRSKMIILPVIMKGKGLLGNMQSLEFMSLSASTAGAAGIGYPFMCNGANLAVEKSVYTEFNDALRMKEVSGDDVFLLHSVKRKYPKKIHYLKSEDAIVSAYAEKNLKSFFRQRIRWASKAGSYKDTTAIIVSLSVFIMNLSIIGVITGYIFRAQFIIPLLIIISGKLIPDLILLYIFGKFSKQRKLLIHFPFVFIFYPFYILVTGTIGLFSKRIKWKD